MTTNVRIADVRFRTELLALTREYAVLRMPPVDDCNAIEAERRDCRLQRAAARIADLVIAVDLPSLLDA